MKERVVVRHDHKTGAVEVVEIHLSPASYIQEGGNRRVMDLNEFNTRFVDTWCGEEFEAAYKICEPDIATYYPLHSDRGQQLLMKWGLLNIIGDKDHTCCRCYVDLKLPQCALSNQCVCLELCDGSVIRDLPRWLVEEIRNRRR